MQSLRCSQLLLELLLLLLLLSSLVLEEVVAIIEVVVLLLLQLEAPKTEHLTSAMMMLIETLIWTPIERRASRPKERSPGDSARQHFEALNSNKMERSMMSL